MAKPATATASTPGFIDRISHFYHEVMDEMKKVSWPSMDETKAHTFVVLYILAFLGVVIGVYDWVFKAVMLLLLKFS
jgi:preprotein translocase subunit SecE